MGTSQLLCSFYRPFFLKAGSLNSGLNNFKVFISQIYFFFYFYYFKIWMGEINPKLTKFCSLTKQNQLSNKRSAFNIVYLSLRKAFVYLKVFDFFPCYMFKEKYNCSVN